MLLAGTRAVPAGRASRSLPGDCESGGHERQTRHARSPRPRSAYARAGPGEAWPRGCSSSGAVTPPARDFPAYYIDFRDGSHPALPSRNQLDFEDLSFLGATDARRRNVVALTAASRRGRSRNAARRSRNAERTLWVEAPPMFITVHGSRLTMFTERPRASSGAGEAPVR